MPLSFPASPVVGATSQQNGRHFQWTGYAWELVAASGSGEDTLLRSLFVPPAPTSVTATAGNAQATVSWTAPTVLAQTPITDYSVQFKTASQTVWTPFTDGTSTATSATVTGLTNGTAYQFRVAAVNGIGTGAYSTASVAVTPVAGDPLFSSVALLLHMDGTGNTFVDSSATPKTITASGNATQSTVQSRFGGNSAAFDGTGDWIATNTNAGLTFGTGDFTIEFWARPTGSQPANPRIIGNLSANAFGAGDWTLTQNLGFGLYAFGYNGGGSPIVSLGSSLTDDTWAHVAIVRSGSDWSMYHNGTRVSTNTFSGSLDTGTRRLVIGSSGSTTEAWNGYIDELRVTKAARYAGATITAPVAAFPDRGLYEDPFMEQVSLLLHADGSGSTFVDSSLTPKEITASGNATQSATQSKWGGKSAYFDGSGDWLSAPNSTALDLSGTSAWVIEGWLYPTANQAYGAILAKRSGSSPTSYQLFFNGQYFGFYDGATMVTSNVQGSLNQWSHFACAYDSGTVRLYWNGSIVGTGSSTISEVNVPLTIGRHFSSLEEAYAGYLDDLRITKGSNRGYTGETILVPTAAFPTS
jgi:hypothetical protein